MTNCKLCKSEQVNQFSELETIIYKESELSVEMEYSVCENCGREFVSKQQILNNDARIRDAKKVVDGLLTSTEILEARESLGLTQEQASLVFGGGRNAFSKYERAEVSQSASMDKLIRMCLKHSNIFHELLTEAGIKIPQEQLCYEHNVVSYKLHKAANQGRFNQVSTIESIEERAYG
ncbi:type II toxin-antitoxin system MqsA family antitoxin [Pseudoalteromonas sp. JC28]|uniref:type II toxin-antitoxin system MqsA family antitoxin n=1 Tax=Pseudoalteromonas sp. JC28 TaxID=2267617 RepID=UPI0015741322|nr:type II toxin-antitoxin system MqsA family antitoxin [Pseudoalteromonas sp. JC28]NSY33794.1 type II toxin-antitoxin system MqsA family antitoxin [Pseudoalteromonas sp. JC28]